MKKTILIIFAVFILTLLSCAPIEPISNPPIEVTPEAVSDSAETIMPIYRIVPYTVDLEAISQVAESLGTENEPTQSDDSYMWIGDGTYYTVYKHTCYGDHEVAQRYEEPMTPLDPGMKDEEYLAIAKDFIQRCGLRLDDLSTKPTIYDYQSVSYTDDQGNGKEDAVLKAVSFNHAAVDGIALDGWAPLRMVAIDYRGKVIQMRWQWFDYEQVGERQLIPEDVAIKRYLSGEAEAIQHFNESVVTTIDKCTLVYYVNTDEEWMRPSYRLDGYNAEGAAATAWILAVEGDVPHEAKNVSALTYDPAYELTLDEYQNSEFLFLMGKRSSSLGLICPL